MPLKSLLPRILIGCRLVLILIFVTFVTMPAKSQISSQASLDKYTYFLVMHKKDGTGFGTGSGFFYRKNKKLYLVTCYHLFTGRDNWSREQRGPYDSIWVRYFENHGAERFATIKTVGETFEERNFYYNPDIYIYEIDPSLFINTKIYSIEDFVRPQKYAGIVPEKQELFSYQYAAIPGGFLDKLKERVLNRSNNQFITTPRLESFFSPTTGQPIKITGIGDGPGSVSLSSLIAISVDSAKLQTRSTWQFNNGQPSTNQFLDFNKNQSSFTPITLSQLIVTDSIPTFANIHNGEVLKITEVKVHNNGNTEFMTTPLQSNQLQVVSINNQPFLSTTGSPEIFANEKALRGPTFFIGNRSSNRNPLTGIGQLPVNQSPFHLEDNGKGGLILKYDDSTRSPLQLLGLSIDKSNSILNASKPDLSVTTAIPPSITAPKLNTGQNLSDFMHFSELEPWYYEASVVPPTNLSSQWDPLKVKYFVTSPSSYHGGSGSPIFIKCTGMQKGKKVEWIQFAGMQCANMTESYPNSVLIARSFTAILKEEEVFLQLEDL